MKAKFFLVAALFLATPVLQASPLKDLKDRVQVSLDAGEQPVLVMDLDETVIDSSERRYLSYKEILPSLSETYPVEVQLASQMSLKTIVRQQNKYDNTELFRSLGVSNEDFIRAAANKMFEVYLQPNYIATDRSILGANLYVRSVLDQGGFVFFVSARQESAVLEATRESLLRLGFITNADQKYHVILKPKGMTTIDFKKRALKRIADMGDINGKPLRVLGVFENEPENLNAMTEAFPDAASFFVWGAHHTFGHLQKTPTILHNYRE